MKEVATREAYGQALVEFGKLHDDLIVLDADLAGATKTCLFKEAFPDRHFDCGIAEANMMSLAAGISTFGIVPFVSSFAMFAAGRAYEQIRNSIGYPHLNVKIAATHAGISVGEDGATHQCNEDIGLMRAIPGMTVICPSDAVETQEAVKQAYAFQGPVYLRLSRYAQPIIHDPLNYKFEIGKGELLKQGEDLTIITTGICVSNALQAAKKLEEQGICAEVINIHTIKPIDKEMIIKSAKKTRRVVTVEEHSIIGGLGSAVSEVLAEYCPTSMKCIGINDTFGESGSAKELIIKYGLDPEHIFDISINMCSDK